MSAQHSDVWEKVVRKLRARQMPPVGMKRPEESTYNTVVAWLSDSLDKASAAASQSRPNRHLPAAQSNRIPERHSRPARAWRSMPPLLPKDEASHGFDNVTVGDSLADAAGSLHLGGAENQPAGGRSAAPFARSGDTFRIRADLTQEEHVEGLPLGTRGGALIPYTFPQDGEYEIQIRLTRDRNEEIEGLREPHELECCWIASE